MYKPKFQYLPLSRETIDGARKYATPDGLKLPSVTTILDATKSEESKRALFEWKKRVGTDKAQAITTEAANRGTRLHSYLEHYIKEGKVQERASNPYSWPSHAMALEVIKHGLKNVNEYWGTEIPLYFPKIYAGTTDCCGIHDGSESIIDFKQSNKEKKREWIEDYFLQLAFYGNAHNELYGTKIRKGVIMMCVKPDMDKDGLMTGEPKYQEFVVEGSEWDSYSDKMWRRIEQYYVKISQE